MSEPTQFDVIVAGGGPAGSVAAASLASAGVRVALFDRSTTPGTPVRCGEAAGSAALADCTPIEPDWVAAHIRGVTMVSPSGISVTVDRMGAGLIVRRDRMDKRLFERAGEAGAELHTGRTVVSVERRDGAYECVISDGSKCFGKCLVIADGVESRLARFLGWDTSLAPVDLSSCAFCRVTHSSVPSDHIEMHYGSRVAPGGYGWVFPRGDGVANVGLGVLGSKSSPGLARERLKAFVQARFGETRMRDEHCGGVPVGKWTRPLARGGAVLIGDAARQVDPLSGGGITHAMNAAKMASRAIVEAFKGGAFNERCLAAYEREWAKGPGKQLLRTYALKQMVIGLDDDTLDTIARKVSTRKGSGAMGLASICFAAFARRPILLLKALMIYR